jgi:hypothetical protein
MNSGLSCTFATISAVTQAGNTGQSTTLAGASLFVRPIIAKWGLFVNGSDFLPYLHPYSHTIHYWFGPINFSSVDD